MLDNHIHIVHMNKTLSQNPGHSGINLGDDHIRV